MLNHYLTLKYWVNNIIEAMKGDQKIATSCYAIAVRETYR